MSDNTEYFVVRGGRAVPVPKNQDLLRQAGRVPHKADEVVTLPPQKGLISRERRLVFYPASGATAWPVARDVVVAPRTFGPADLKNLLGPYLADLMRRALAVAETFSKKDLAMMLLMSLCGTLSIVTLVKVW